MIDVTDLRIFVCTTPTNMNLSFDRLMGRAREIFEQDPFSGHLFLFMNRARDRMKILFWDRDGFCIWYKRLEKGEFHFPSNDQRALEIEAADLSLLLEGIDLDGAKRRKRFQLALH